MVKLTKNLPHLIQIVVKTCNDLQLLLDYSKGSFFRFWTAKNDSRISTVICVFPKNSYFFGNVFEMFLNHFCILSLKHYFLASTLLYIFFCSFASTLNKSVQNQYLYHILQ